MHRKERKIPTIFALFILFISIGGIVVLNQTSHQINSKAQSSSHAEDINISNVFDTSFTVSWFTAIPTTGKIIVKGNNTSKIFIDDADTDNISRPRMTHFITAKNLTENTPHSIQIISGDGGCNPPNICPNINQKTANPLAAGNNLPAARGSIISKDDKPVNNAIVYLFIGKNPPLSAKTDSIGLWVASLNNLRTPDLLTKPHLADNDIVQIIAKISPEEKAEAVIDIKSLRQNLAIPPLQIGKSYNLIDLISKKGLLAGPNVNNTLGIQTKTENSVNGSIDILFPASDGDTTTDTQPRFRGIAPPKGQLILTVNSAPQTAKVIAGSDGAWSWRPPLVLQPGIHHLGVSGYDDKKKLITLNRRFIILKSGERVLGEATASATLTPTSTPSVSPTMILVPSPSPTFILLSSPTPSLIPVITSSIPTATPVIPPKTASVRPTLFLLGVGITLLILGFKSLLMY